MSNEAYEMNDAHDFAKDLNIWARENNIDPYARIALLDIIKDYAGLSIIKRCRETIKVQRNLLKLHNIRMD